MSGTLYKSVQLVVSGALHRSVQLVVSRKNGFPVPGNDAGEADSLETHEKEKG